MSFFVDLVSGSLEACRDGLELDLELVPGVCELDVLRVELELEFWQFGKFWELDVLGSELELGLGTQADPRELD